MNSRLWTGVRWACALGLLLFLVQKQFSSSSARTFVFSGDSSSLSGTEIVPVLSSAIVPGKTMMWCSSFQIAWNRLKDDVIKQPIKLQNNDALANALNVAEQGENDIAAKNVFAAAGFAKDGILRTIKDGLAKKFPTKVAPDFKLHPDDILTYAYLEVDVIFPYPYADSSKKIAFKSSNGKSVPVAAFGFELNERDDMMKHQPELLYAAGSEEVASEFVIDLCSSSEDQIVIARVPQQETLEKTLRYALSKKFDEPGDAASIMQLKIPNIAGDITHRFAELEMKKFANTAFQKYFIAVAQQRIDFKLDRGGARLKSEAHMAAAKSAKTRSAYDIIADRPFLLYMKRRDAKHPYFVMWVDSAELLTK